MAKGASSHPPVSLDFTTFAFSELMQMRSELEKEMQSRKAKEVEDLRAKVAESAEALGVSIEEIFGLYGSSKRETRHARGKQPPKYRGPKGEEWSGRGPAPRWMKPFLAAGKKKEDFLIQK